MGARAKGLPPPAPLAQRDSGLRAEGLWSRAMGLWLGEMAGLLPWKGD